MDNNPEKAFETILGDPKLLPLTKFKSNKLYTNNIFPDAKQLPQFFQNNLQNNCRVVKQLAGSIGILRIFYFQLLKLGFQIESPKHDYSKLFKRIFFDERILEDLGSPISGKQYSGLQYLRILADAITQLQKQTIPNIEMTIGTYPIIDQAMLSLLEIIIEKNCIENITMKNNQKIFTISELLNKLCSIFQIHLQIYGDCYSFEESDVFMYAESISKVYMAYLSEMAEIQSAEQTSQTQTVSKGTINREQFVQNSWVHDNDRFRFSAGNINRNRKTESQNYLNQIARKSVGSQRQIQNIAPKNVFDTNQDAVYQPKYNNRQKEVDSQNVFSNIEPILADSQIIPDAEYADSQNLSENSSILKNQIQSRNKANSQTRNYEQFDEYGFRNKNQQKLSQFEEINKNYNRFDKIFEVPPQLQEKKGILKNYIIDKISKNKSNKFIQQKEHIQQPNHQRQEIIEPIKQIKQPPTQIQAQQVQFYDPHKHRKFISPKKLNLNLNLMHNNPKIDILHNKKEQNQKKKQSKNKDQTLGTFYREFTDTRVMEAMIQPHKTRVRITRKHFQGIRSKGFTGLPFLK